MGYLATPSPQAASNLDERAAGGAPAEKPIVRAKIGNEQYGLPPDMVRRNSTNPRHTNDETRPTPATRMTKLDQPPPHE